MSYTLIDHTADFGIRVSAGSLSELFVDTALALTDLLTETDRIKARQVLTLEAEGLDLPDLMVAWLRECLYLWNGRRKLIQAIEIRDLETTRLVAEVAATPFEAGLHVIRHEIKAVTYHQLRVRQTASGWETAVIFDV